MCIEPYRVSVGFPCIGGTEQLLYTDHGYETEYAGKCGSFQKMAQKIFECHEFLCLVGLAKHENAPGVDNQTGNLWDYPLY
jgi:hypothetical protein